MTTLEALVVTRSGDPGWLWEFAAEDFVHARLSPESAGSDWSRQLIRRQVHSRFEKIEVPRPNRLKHESAPVE